MFFAGETSAAVSFQKRGIFLVGVKQSEAHSVTLPHGCEIPAVCQSLAAVFASNFTSPCCTSSENILKKTFQGKGVSK